MIRRVPVQHRTNTQTTGFTPSTLPDNYATDQDIRISTPDGNDPTAKTAILL